MTYSKYKPSLRKLSRNHRNNSTKAEIRIWCELLRGSKMNGYRFLRQVPIENYIVDFLCKELNLIIEIDGATHDFLESEIKDRLRQERLEYLGYSFLRFSDQSVHERLPDVAEILFEWIKNYENIHGKKVSARNKKMDE